MKNRIVILLLALMPVSEVLARPDYTYVKSSLAFPWFMFFVFFALIMIPFFMVIVLAWRKTDASEKRASDTAASQPSTPTTASLQKGLFNRFVLPSILIFVAIFSILMVLNAYEAMDLMEQSGLAAPTMLNPRP
ncbi:MAG: hypothetical protein ACC650_07505 [Gammaproteobacteria bacterium]